MEIANILNLIKFPSPPNCKMSKKNSSFLSRICKYASESMIKSLPLEVAKAQTFDSKDFFSAVRVIRAFSESSLYSESDVFVSTLQCAACASNLNWDVKSRVIQTRILRECWRTVFHNIDSSKTLNFAVRRTHEHALGLGIFLILPTFLQQCRGKAFTIHILDADVYILFTYIRDKEKSTLRSVYVLSDPRQKPSARTMPLSVDKSVDTVESLFKLGLPSPTSTDGLVSPPELNSAHSSTSTSGHGDAP